MCTMLSCGIISASGAILVKKQLGEEERETEQEAVGSGSRKYKSPNS